jgi:hypothetical protein
MIKKQLLWFAGVVVLMTSPALFGHCDGLDGPVVQAGRKALATENVNLALIWVQPSAGKELTEVFKKVLRVRGLGPEQREVADSYFLETLVRLHRMGEGEPYTGLKPAGRDVGPVVRAFDRALETGSEDELLGLFAEKDRATIRREIGTLRARKSFEQDDVAAGRKFVSGYVKLLHHLQEVHAGDAHKATTSHGH